MQVTGVVDFDSWVITFEGTLVWSALQDPGKSEFHHCFCGVIRVDLLWWISVHHFQSLPLSGDRLHLCNPPGLDVCEPGFFMMLPFLGAWWEVDHVGSCEWLIREVSHMIVRRAVLFSLAAGVIGVMPLVKMGLVRESQMVRMRDWDGLGFWWSWSDLCDEAIFEGRRSSNDDSVMMSSTDLMQSSCFSSLGMIEDCFYMDETAADMSSLDKLD
ncbi:hypothetical protein Dimus_023380 [Dionaea muscipula]